jgi:hypothetical protein
VYIRQEKVVEDQYPWCFADALTECDHIIKDLCSDIAKTNAWCAEVRDIVEKRIAAGETITKCHEVLLLEKQGETCQKFH